MNDKRLEHIIKQKLAEYRSDGPADWAAFAASYKMDREADVSSPIDNIIKDKLDNYTTDHQPQWAAFLQKKADVEYSENNDPSDAIIREKLDNHTSPETGNWSAFLQYKDNSTEREADDNLDQTIVSKLDNYTTDQQPHWDAFRNYREAHLAGKGDQRFDNRVRDELDDYVDDSQPHWPAFLAYRESTDSTEDDFDSKIREELEDYAVDSQPQWLAFQNFRDQYDANLADQDFDNQVREELENYSVLSAPQWAAFLAYRNNHGSNSAGEQGFDNAVRAELAAYQSAVTPNWDSFKTKKDGLDQSSPEDSSDYIIKEKLDNYVHDSSPQWEKLLEKKRRSDAVYADSTFDKGINDVVGRYTQRYNSSHWLKLKARLEKIAYVRKQIFTFKAMEMVFVCLMVFTLGNHLQNITGYAPSNADNNVVLSDVPLADASQDILTETKTDVNTNTSAQQDNAEVSSVNNNSGLARNNDRTSSQSNNSGLGVTDRGTNNVSNSIIRDSQQTDGSTTTNNSIPTTTQETSGNQLPPLGIGSQSAIAKAMIAGVPFITSGLQLTDLDKLERALPQTADVEYFDAEAKPTYQDEGSWWHIYNAIDNNYISTPSTSDPTSPPTVREKFGYSLEVLFSKQKGRLELEGGLGYSFVNYTPLFQPFTYDVAIENSNSMDIREVDFTNIKLDFVSIPLKAKYHFISNGRWSISGAMPNIPFVNSL